MTLYTKGRREKNVFDIWISPSFQLEINVEILVDARWKG